MEIDAVIGCAVIAGALGALSYLVWWSRRTIERIGQNGSRSAREIDRERRRGR